MNSSSLKLPLIALDVVLGILLLLDFVFDSEPIVYASFAPVLLWALVLAARGRG